MEWNNSNALGLNVPVKKHKRKNHKLFWIFVHMHVTAHQFILGFS